MVTGEVIVGFKLGPIGVVLIIVEMRLEESSKKSYEGVGLDWLD